MKRPLYGWLASEAISITGTRVSMVALPFLVLTTTGSPQKTGLVALAEMAPLVVMKVLGGPVIDRVGARRVSITCDVASVLVVGAIPLLYAADRLPFLAFLGLVAVAGGLRGPGDAAKTALTPALVAEAGVPMERATGLHSTVERTASMLGAAFAGGLVAVIGPANALIVDALSFGVSAAVLAWATRPLVRRSPAGPTRPAPDPSSQPEDEPYLRQLKEGWAFLSSDRLLVGITVMVTLTNLLDMAWVAVLVPVWGVESGGGAAAIGLVFAAFSGASAVGAICASAWAASVPRYATYLVAFLVCGAPRFVVMAFDSPVWAVIVVIIAGGFMAGFLNPILGAVIFERIPEPLVGRVTSLTTACCFALVPFGGLLGGILVGSYGLSVAMLACGAVYLAVTMLPAVDPRWREIDHRPRPVVEPEPGQREKVAAS